MKKFFTLIMLLAMAVPTFASEKTVTISRNEGEYSEASTVYYAVKDGIILTMTGGMNNINYLLANPNTNFTVLSYNYTITKIVFHCLDDAVEGDLDAGYWGPSTITLFANHTNPNNPGTYTSSGFIGTWEGMSSSLNFAVKGKGVRFASIDITYEKPEGDIYELVTQRSQIVEGKSYVVVSQYNDKVMRFKEATDATPQAEPIVEWMNEEKTRVKVDGDAMIIRMMGVQDSTIGSNTRRVAWFKLGNGYLRGQGDNLTVNSNASDYGRAIMYISNVEYNYLCWFKNVGSSTKTIRYDYDNEQFMFKSINNDPNGRVWLYKLAESYQVTTACTPEDAGTITLGDGVVNGTSQEGETVKFTVDAASGYAIDNVTLTNLSTGEVTVISDTRDGELSFVMPASDVLVTADFTQSTAIESIANASQVTSVEYYNLAGMRSSKPFSGMNIVVTRYSDGSKAVEKIVK
jgi:hypothetical protein